MRSAYLAPLVAATLLMPGEARAAEEMQSLAHYCQTGSLTACVSVKVLFDNVTQMGTVQVSAPAGSNITDVFLFIIQTRGPSPLGVTPLDGPSIFGAGNNNLSPDDNMTLGANRQLNYNLNDIQAFNGGSSSILGGAVLSMKFNIAPGLNLETVDIGVQTWHGYDGARYPLTHNNPAKAGQLIPVPCVGNSLYEPHTCVETILSPEPVTVALLGTGLLFIGVAYRRRRTATTDA